MTRKAYEVRNLLWTWFVDRLNWSMARWRHAKAVEIIKQCPTSRWCDHVEREINNQVIYGDPRGGNRPW